MGISFRSNVNDTSLARIFLFILEIESQWVGQEVNNRYLVCTLLIYVIDDR